VALLTFVFTVGVLALPTMDFIAGLVVKSIYCLIYIALLFLFHVLDQRELQGLLAFWRGTRVRAMGQES